MRLIDADLLREEVYSWGMNDYEPSDFIDAIDNAPTVEAIPKVDYENRLKAEMVDMLEELDFRLSNYQGTDLIRQDIQEKINSLNKGEYRWQ